MKRIFTLITLSLLGTGMLLSPSCKEDDLNFKTEPAPATTAGIGSGDTAGIAKTPDHVSIPVVVRLSAPASRAFEINVSANPDTIETLIGNNTLKDTYLLPAGSYTLPNAVAIPYGTSEVRFNMDVTMTTIEKNFGRKLAMAVRLTNPTKDNKLDPAKSMEIVTINTSELIREEDIHYVGFGKGLENLLYPGTNSYTLDPKSLNIPLNVHLAGAATTFFNVKLAANQDTIAQLIANNTLPNTIALTATDFTIDTAVVFPTGRNDVSTTLAIKTPVIFRPSNGDKQLAVALQLSNPNKHLLKEETKTQIVLINPAAFRPYLKTPFRLPENIGQSAVLKLENYDNGGEGVAYHDNDASNNGGQYRPSEGVDIGGGNGSYQVGWTGDGEWITYSVVIPVSGTYEIATRTGTPNEEPGRFHFELNNQDVTGTIYSFRSGDYSIFVPRRKVVQLTAGSYVLKFYEDRGNYDVKDVTFTRLDPATLPKDVTRQAELTVSRNNESNENENASKVVDGNPGSKFLLFDFAGLWMQLKFPAPVATGMYTLISGNDGPDRDPKNWQLLGSNDGVNWTVLDTRNEEKFALRGQTNTYTFDNKVKFQYYKLDITANNGGGLFQLGEWSLLQRP
ncbi:MAG: DUF1735 domain-containing protein [Mucilaginibacter polytrichastri]|nr:DUF1735 domain-containing protein [Mucilaginibacter polytrichastri]